jgi:hypothetical protein
MTNDGGYYAIKGFLYQFDKTLIDVLNEPKKTVEVENRQDIAIQNFVIQVKHKETQTYQPSKIRGPVIQLIDLFKVDQEQKFCLYCHFRDKQVERWDLTVDELDTILKQHKEDYTKDLKSKFVNNFYVQFSTDFETQFQNLIRLIRERFSLKQEDRAFIYHSLFRSKLLDISIIKDKEDRLISKVDLDAFIKSAEKTVFYGAYSKFLNRKRYENLIKREYFTFKAVNIDNFERLFIVDCDEEIGRVDLHKIVTCIQNKYFRVGKSPQPFLCFVNLEDQKLTDLKCGLVDQGIVFNDGTCFDGDRFRLDMITENSLNSDSYKVKIIDETRLRSLLTRQKFQETFQFYLQEPLDLRVDGNHVRIQISGTSRIVSMIQ